VILSTALATPGDFAIGAGWRCASVTEPDAPMQGKLRHGRAGRLRRRF